MFVVFAGANAVGVRFALVELPPFFAAAVRFGAAGLLLLALMAVGRRPVPRGDRLTGTLLFAIFAFALPYAFLYQALRDAPAGTSMLMLAIVPLLTLLLAVVQGVERPRLLGLVGALIAGFGIVVVSADQLSLDVPLLALVLLVFAALSQAESGVVVKRFPPGDPVAANAIGMLLGGGLLGVAAVVAGETPVVPVRLDTWLAMLYLVGPGSIGVFVLVLYVLSHWTASVTSYAFLLFPIVAVVLGALLLAEPVQPSFLAGGAIVLAGVYIGAVYRPRARAPEGSGESADESAGKRVAAGS